MWFGFILYERTVAENVGEKHENGVFWIDAIIQ